MNEWRETSTAFARFRHNDDILETRMKDGAIETLETAKSNLALGNELIGEGKSKPMLLVLGRMLNMNPEARRLYSKREGSVRRTSKIALVMNSYISRVIGNLFIGLCKGDTPIRLFTDEDTAVNWLKKPITKE
jgi:hypothetical protein